MSVKRFIECLAALIYRRFEAQGVDLVMATDSISKMLGRKPLEETEEVVPPAQNDRAFAEFSQMMAGVKI